MRSQPLPAAYAVTSASRIPVSRHTAIVNHAAAITARFPVYARSEARCRATVNECRGAAVRYRVAVACRVIRRCRATVIEYAAVRCRFARSPTVYRYLTTHHTVRINPPSSLVQSTKQIRFILTLLNRTMRHVNCWTTGQETVTYLDRGKLEVAAAQARRVPNGKPDLRDCSTGANADNWERSAAPEWRERTRLPLRHGAGEAAVQRTGGRTHPSDDKPDALQEWSRLAEERQNEQQEDTKRRQCHRIRQGRIPAASAQLSSAKAGHRSRSPNEGETGNALANLNATHQVGRGLESEVLTLRSSAKAERSYQGVDNGGGGICRVNMIRVHRRQEEPKEPKFGESRAAPLQGADSGRPSGSSEVRGMGQEQRTGPGGAHLKDDHGSSTFMHKRKLPEVPYSATSSEGRYDRTGQNKDARPKTSTRAYVIIPNTAVFGPTNFIGTTTASISTARMKISG